MNINGTNGPDRLVGTNQGDVIKGENGNDTLIGGGGNDFIFDGGGTDRLDGGAGGDTFIFADDGDRDVVVGNERRDQYDLRRIVGVDNLGEFDIDNSGTNAVVTDNEGEVIFIALNTNLFDDQFII